MSTASVTESRIPYKQFITNGLNNHEIEDPPRVIYTTSSKIVVATIERRKNYIHVRDDNGFCEFERFGGARIDATFRELTRQYNVQIFDEYGVPWKDYDD